MCGAAHIGQLIHFEAEITIDTCTGNGRHRFAIKPDDLSESVQIDVDISCDCDCGDEVSCFVDHPQSMWTI